MNYHTCTDYGISEFYYGAKQEKLGGTGQGNSVSGATCRDTSCLIFKWLEELQIGAKTCISRTARGQQRLVIAFINDADFYTNGMHSIMHM